MLTGHNVGHMHVLNSAAVLSDWSSRLAVPVALMRPRPIPLDLAPLLWHAKVQPYARQSPAATQPLVVLQGVPFTVIPSDDCCIQVGH